MRAPWMASTGQVRAAVQSEERQKPMKPCHFIGFFRAKAYEVTRCENYSSPIESTPARKGKFLDKRNYLSTYPLL